ncbi:hypothetical protein T10_8385 [Trichinella papuae]|uniref:Uncharacterized protein n=1 Tax=Trichinella papuae TaxID=268474 RepID=A0A0V1M0B8_9BILA|nr:hypothetical protein T10_8385 [Trichinella papuae]
MLHGSSAVTPNLLQCADEGGLEREERREEDLDEYEEKKERISYRNRTAKGMKLRHSDSQKDSKTSTSSRLIESVIVTDKGTAKYPYDDGK